MNNKEVYTCDNCKFEFSMEHEFCPECGVQIIVHKVEDENYYICPICENKNPIGEKKCAYCCSIL